jgi:HK97 family phage prohead protease
VTVPDPTFETRTVAAQFEMRDDSTTGAPVFEGYASVFDTPYDLGPFWEQVDQRAFNRTLGQNPDVRLLVDHQGQPLARTKSGTLQLNADTRGLHAKATLDPTDPDVQRLLPKMRRGDLDQMSFSFRVVGGDGDAWDYGSQRTLRTLKELSLADQDVSIVTYPASTTTMASLRSAESIYVERMGRELRSGHLLPHFEVIKLRRAVERLEDEARGLTANDTRDSLNEAVSEALSGAGYGYVLDYDDANVYYCRWSESESREETFSQGYTLGEDGVAALTGEATSVRRRTLWAPVAEEAEAEAEPETATPVAARSLQTARYMLEALEL